MLKKSIKRCLAIVLCFVIALSLVYMVPPQPKVEAAAFANGADTSWVVGMEKDGWSWKDKNGVTRDIFQILKNDYGINSIRIRSWVNPSTDSSNGLLDQKTSIALAKRASNAGMRIMICLHYSDSWADPGKQYTPAAWANMNITQLSDQVYTYTRNFMLDLQAQGVTPEWVQIGNETNNGMLWPLGRHSDYPANFARLVTSGHDAVKSVSSSTRTIVHLANGHDNARFRSIFNTLTSNNARYDLIGMSVYPTESKWQSNNTAVLNNMQDMKSRYGKDTVIVEAGMTYTSGQTCKDFIADLVSKTKSVNGLGVFYWEPQCIYNWNTYNKGAWNNNGTPTVALEGFGSTPPPSSVTYVKIRNRATNLNIDGYGYTADGSVCNQHANGSSYNQQWVIEPAGSYVKIKNRATGLYLDGAGRTTNGADCGQWSSSTSFNQQWTQETVGSYVKFKNRATGLYLDGMGRTENGSALGQYSSGSSSNQQWSLVAP